MVYEQNRSSNSAKSNISSRDLSLKGWTSRLAIIVTIALTIESISGVWIYIAPFSISSQIQVILHTLTGILFFIPVLVYLTRHILVWYNQGFTVTMVLGYTVMVMVLLCMISGIPLTWESLVGSKIEKVWDIIHLVTGIIAFVTIFVHLFLAFYYNRYFAKKNLQYSTALRKFAYSSIIWIAGVIAISLGIAILWPGNLAYFPVPEGYSLPSYIQEYDEYKGSPFAPTYATTDNRNMINPEILGNSQSCGTSRCHDQILAEWQPSAHRFAAMNPPFMQVQKNFAKDRNTEETRYCAGCHDPISLFSGAKDIQNLELNAPGIQEGISCAVCHSISRVDQRGNADYVVTAPRKYLWEVSDGMKKFVSDFLIRAYPRQHLEDYDRNLLRTPEFCGACHKQFIPEALNRFGLTPGQNQYNEWRKSHWHTEEADTDLSCRDCHMRLVYNSNDPGRGEKGDIRRTHDDEAHRHHGTIATNLFMPEILKLPNWESQTRLTKEWIQGKTVIPEIDHLWPRGPVAVLEIISPERADKGEDVSVTVVVKNRKAGHNFITGPLDFIRAWIHLQVLDEQENLLYEWGLIDPITRSIFDVPGQVHQIGNSRKQGTLVLEGLPLNGKGKPIKKHELWEAAGGKGQRTIFPGYSDKQIYKFKVPPNVEGNIVLKADLNFRRYRQEFLDLVVPALEKETGVYQPTVTKDSQEKRIFISNKGSMDHLSQNLSGNKLPFPQSSPVNTEKP